ncbi:MAG TPA: PDDEXK nuclease domain-containing protein [Bacteroidales bacterium]|nr:PDDEXK nuclease domain-containing protein [Bacteroidales bacterium]
MNFEQLVAQIEVVHNELQLVAVRQVNNLLTMRNILIGYYIVEYEQNGADRAEYGANTINSLASRLKHIKGISNTQLYRFREFYITYPHILSAVSIKLQNTNNQSNGIFPTVSGKLEHQFESLSKIFPTVSGISSTIQKNELSFEPEVLLSTLHFSHFVELINIDDTLKRSFYEVQAIKNNWSARELGRAINTMLYERTGLSNDKEQVVKNFKADKPTIAEIIKNPFFLEFIGLEEKPQYTETDLEQAIINHLQTFLTELGRGFCFEARQKRITFDNKHYRIDLVFYHRILKCHILIDLKIGSFDHADAGQMNMYLNYFAKNENTEGDNPPVGIILCANKNDSLVEYTTTGLSNEVFVSKYLVQLPSKAELENFIAKELKQLEEGE